jgi:hypothetical protein
VVCIYHHHDAAALAFNTTFLMDICYCVQLDRLVKEFIVPLEKQISSEQEEKQVPEKHYRRLSAKRDVHVQARLVIVHQMNKWLLPVGQGEASGSRLLPPDYAPVVEEESWTTSPHASSGVVTRNTTLTASRPPLENSSASDETTMNGNEDVNISSSRRMVAVAAATRVHKGSKVQKTFDERFKDLKSFKAEFGHCNVPTSRTRSKNNKHLSLGCWCNRVRESYNAIKEGRSPRWLKLSKANIQRLENAGFEWNLSF